MTRVSAWVGVPRPPAMRPRNYRAVVTSTEPAIREHVRAVNAGDLPALLAGFAADARFQTGDHVVIGSDDIRAFFTEAFAGLRPQLEITNLFVDEGRAACELRDTVTVDGEKRTYASAAFFSLDRGVITDVKVYREGLATV